MCTNFMSGDLVFFVEASEAKKYFSINQGVKNSNMGFLVEELETLERLFGDLRRLIFAQCGVEMCKKCFSFKAKN